jgi:uncharacterized protein
LYQHDVKAKHLRASLDAVVESCVNYVGVDVNTASPALLRYVSGLNQLTARRVYDHRLSNGPFRNREQLKEVPGFGEATFVQAAGFLKIADGDNPLDATWIHPESYEVAKQTLEKLGFSLADLRQKETPAAIAQKVAEFNGQTEQLAADWHVGLMTLRDILAQLTRPGRDPREDLPAPIFKRGVLKLEDLQPGMELMGSVLNVVDFGAFVDIGLHDSGLVHVSQLANRFVRDPHDVVSVGDIVKVWVMEIDKTRRRVSLTMIAPGTPRHEPRPRHTRGEGRPGDTGEQQRPPRGNRPPRRRPAATGQPPRQAPAAPGAATQPASAQGHETEKSAEASTSSRPAPAARGVRPPHVGRKPYGRSHDRSGQQHTHSRPKPKPRPQIPITKAMKEGKEPLRTFGDLMQFYKFQANQDAPATGQMQAEGGTQGSTGKPEESQHVQGSVEQATVASRQQSAESTQSPVVSQSNVEPAQAAAEKPSHASNGAEPDNEVEAPIADPVTGASADSTV